MTVTTVYATAPGGDAYVFGDNATYATARTTCLSAGDLHAVGQFWDASGYEVYESFVIFDTSPIADTDDVSAVSPSFDGDTDGSTTDFTVKLAASSYNGGAVDCTDWVSGASLGALTVLATWATSGYGAGYNTFTSTGDFPAAINKTGNTALIIFSSRHADGTTPTGDEWVVFTDADAAGTTTDPKLDITHAPSAGLSPISRLTLLGVS